jgi:hypothetical protein
LGGSSCPGISSDPNSSVAASVDGGTGVPSSNLLRLRPFGLLRATFFRAAVFRPAVMRVAILRPAVFLRVPVLRVADLRPFVFRAALLRAADLRVPILRPALFRTADFRAAVLRIADFRRALLRTPVLRGRPGLRVLGITPSSAWVTCIAQYRMSSHAKSPRTSLASRLAIKIIFDQDRSSASFVRHP